MVNERLAAQIYGFTRTSTSNCVCHNRPQDRSTFRDEVSFKEFGISGLCQRGQDDVFGGDDLDEDGVPWGNSGYSNLRNY